MRAEANSLMQQIPEEEARDFEAKMDKLLQLDKMIVEPTSAVHVASDSEQSDTSHY